MDKKALLKDVDILEAISGEVSSDAEKRLAWVENYGNRWLLRDLIRENNLNGTFYYAPRFMVVNTVYKTNTISVPSYSYDKNVIGVEYFEDLFDAVTYIKHQVHIGRGLPALYFFEKGAYRKRVYYVGKSVCKHFRTGGYRQNINGVTGVSTQPFITGCEKEYYSGNYSLEDLVKSMGKKDEIFVEIPDLWEVKYSDSDDEDYVEYYNYHAIEQVSDNAAFLLFSGLKDVRVTCSEYILTYNIDRKKLDMDCMSDEDISLKEKSLKDYIEDDMDYDDLFFSDDDDDGEYDLYIGDESELDFEVDLSEKEDLKLEMLGYTDDVPDVKDIKKIMGRGKDEDEGYYDYIRALDASETRCRAHNVKEMIDTMGPDGVEYCEECFDDKFSDFKEYVEVKVEFGII